MGRAKSKRTAVEAASWCIVGKDDKVFRALITHVGRGRYKILDDNQEKSYVGVIVDASDVFHCDVEK